MFSLESPHRGDSNDYTSIPFSIQKKKIDQNYSKSAAMVFKNEFEIAMVNER